MKNSVIISVNSNEFGYLQTMYTHIFVTRECPSLGAIIVKVLMSKKQQPPLQNISFTS